MAARSAAKKLFGTRIEMATLSAAENLLCYFKYKNRIVLARSESDVVENGLRSLSYFVSA